MNVKKKEKKKKDRERKGYHGKEEIKGKLKRPLQFVH